MEKPGWATFVGIIMLFIGGCSALNNVNNTSIDKFDKMQDEMLMEVEIAESQSQSSYDDADTIEINTQIDSTDEKVITFFGDSIVKDSNNNVDMKATLKNITKISPYRIKWIRIFAYVGLAMAVLFVISGIFFLSQKKYTIPLALTVLAISLAVGVLKFIIFRADTETSSIIHTFSNFGIYWSIFLDMVLLIVIMVLDKTYYYDKPITEDYYDQ